MTYGTFTLFAQHNEEVGDHHMESPTWSEHGKQPTKIHHGLISTMMAVMLSLPEASKASLTSRWAGLRP